MAHSRSGRLERKLLADLGSLDSFGTFLVVVVVGGGVGAGTSDPGGVAAGAIPPGGGGWGALVELLPVILVAVWWI